MVIGFWIFMLIVDLLIPVTMIVFGWRFIHQPPENINPLYGYRTAMSMKNKDTWDFAHQYCGKIWYTAGLILLPVSIIAMLFALGKPVATVGACGGIICVLQCIPLVGTIIPTEQALKKIFDDSGARK